MSFVVVIEELAGQHADLQPPPGRRVPYCRCNGAVERGSDSCLRCGRYKRDLFQVRFVDHSHRGFDALMRSRPHSEMEAA